MRRTEVKTFSQLLTYVHNNTKTQSSGTFQNTQKPKLVQRFISVGWQAEKTDGEKNRLEGVQTGGQAGRY